MEKVLKAIFVGIIVLLVIAVIIILLPIVLIGLLLGMITGKLKVANLNSMRKNGFGVPGMGKSNIPPSSTVDNEPVINYQEGDIIDIQAEEVKEK